jgi:hypothetical protein
MLQRQVLQQFASESPLTVMSRVMLETIFPANRFEQLFKKKEAKRLQFRESLFQTVVGLMGLAGQIHSKTHAAHQATHNDLRSFLDSFYGEFAKANVGMPAEWVRRTADQLDPVVHRMGRIQLHSLCGYSVKTVAPFDFSGGHLDESVRTNRKTTPCHSLVVLDPNSMLAVDVVPHKEKLPQDSMRAELLDRVHSQDIWLFPPTNDFSSFAANIEQRQAFFLLHQSKAKLSWMPAGRRRMRDKLEFGNIFEQKVHLVNGPGERLPARRITIALEKSSPDGQLDLHILTNLPRRFQSLRLAEFYYRQWMVEMAFADLAANMHGAVSAMGHSSDSSLLAYCLALIAYNILSMVNTVVCAVREQEETNSRTEVPWRCWADEISSAWRGMMIALPCKNWADSFTGFTARRLTNTLVSLAKNVRLPEVTQRSHAGHQAPVRSTKGMHFRVYDPANATG